MDNLEQKEGKARSFSPRKVFIVGGIIIIVVVITFLIYFLFFNGPKNICGDGTPYNQCSENKPYFCNDGKLVELASQCGCPSILDVYENKCVSNYSTGEKTISLNYILKGERNKISFETYSGIVDYLSSLPSSINYQGNETPTREDFKKRDIDEPLQREMLLPLVVTIENLADLKEEQARIAISLVQNIPYGESNKSSSFLSRETEYSRLPYEVVYDYKGICGEKSELLVFLLKEIGYKSGIFYYSDENHEAVAISCPIKRSIDNSGYCFVETTGPSILTDNEIEYVGSLTLKSLPLLIKLYDGNSLPSGMYEYGDAKTLIKIREGKFVLFWKVKLEKLKEKYGLVEEYNVG